MKLQCSDAMIHGKSMQKDGWQTHWAATVMMPAVASSAENPRVGVSLASFTPMARVTAHKEDIVWSDVMSVSRGSVGRQVQKQRSIADEALEETSHRWRTEVQRKIVLVGRDAHHCSRMWQGR